MLRFGDNERAEIAYLIQAGLDNLNRLHSEIVGIRRDMQQASDKLRAGITTKAAMAADLDSALADIQTAMQRLQSVRTQFCDAEAFDDATAEALCDTLDEIQLLGQRINKSSDAFNRVIRTNVESN